jgi:hypothetical protein
VVLPLFLVSMCLALALVLCECAVPPLTTYAPLCATSEVLIKLTGKRLAVRRCLCPVNDRGKVASQ